jgi:hypothetical protein
VKELLGVFDVVRAEHEQMDADKFNDDGTYKAGTNQVRDGVWRNRPGAGEGAMVGGGRRAGG